MNLKINNRFEINAYKIIILVCLSLASFCAFQIVEADLCVMGYYENGVVTHFYEIKGSEIDDMVVFGAAGILGFIFSPMYFFRLSRSWWIGLFTTLCLLQFFCLSLVTIPLNQIIYDSVKFCDNFWIVAFLIFQFIFIILNLLYINISKHWKSA